MWIKYAFWSVILIAVIRIIVVFTSGEMSGTEKVRKVSNWFVGLVLVFISWKVIDSFFEEDLGDFSKDNSNLELKTRKKEIKNRTDYKSDSTGIRILNFKDKN